MWREGKIEEEDEKGRKWFQRTCWYLLLGNQAASERTPIHPHKKAEFCGAGGCADPQKLRHTVTSAHERVLPTGQEKKEHREVQGNPKQAHNGGCFRAVLSLCCQQSQQAFCAA